MAKLFTNKEWQKINAELDRDESGYGLPELKQELLEYIEI